MQTVTSQDLRLFIRLSRPGSLLIGTLLYTLGAGIVRYLGLILDWNLFWLGLVWLLLLQLSAHYLLDYFLPHPNPNIEFTGSPYTNGTNTLGLGKLPRPVALWSAFATLSVTASLSVLLIRDIELSPAALLILIGMLLGVLAYTVPPFRLAETGYGEMFASILFANLIPSFAFLVQTGDLHRLLAMSTFPLTALHLAMVIIFGFQDFARDIKFERLTLLVRMGWRDGMAFHNILIVSAYLLLGVAMIFGMPLLLALPAFLTLPLGLFQVWSMTRISAGARPNWPTLRLIAISLFAGCAYLLAYAFWTR